LPLPLVALSGLATGQAISLVVTPMDQLKVCMQVQYHTHTHPHAQAARTSLRGAAASTAATITKAASTAAAAAAQRAPVYYSMWHCATERVRVSRIRDFVC
jgi:hypothetical protein